MFSIKLEELEGDGEIVVEIPEEYMSIYTLMTSFENILIEYGFSKDDIEKFYIKRQRGFDSNIDMN